MVTVDEYSKLSAADKGKINKADRGQLIEQLIALNNGNNRNAATANDSNTSPSNADIMQEITQIRKDISEILELKATVKKMHTEINTAYDIINNQMRYMEIIDSKERGTNLIITGVPEDNNTSLEMQVKEVITATGYNKNELKLNNGDDDAVLGLFIGNEELSIKRLGQIRPEQGNTRSRAILVKLPSKSTRDDIAACGKGLKEHERYKRVFVKKDTHPAFRKEHGRIRKRIYDEKNNPVNVGKVIAYDKTQRVVLCDNIIIDRFRPIFL